MDVLPPELFSLIADQCAHSSLKCLRLVNREYCEAVTPRVFEHFYMAILDESHDKLVEISKSTLAKHVKSFTVYLDHLPDWNRERWENAINCQGGISSWEARRRWQCASTMQQTGEIPDALPLDLPDDIASDEGCELRHHFSSRQLDLGWKEFERVRQEQLQWHESRYGMVLKECLAMLPNLDAVTCAPVNTIRLKAFRGICPVWKRMRRRILVSPNDWATFLPTSGVQAQAAYLDFSRRVSFLVLEAIAFRASFSGTKYVTQLVLHSRQNGPWERMITRPVEFSKPAPDWNEFRRRATRIWEGLWTLTHIDWCISISPRSENDSSSLAGEFLLFLRKTRNLQSLSLSFYKYYNNPRAIHITGPGDAIIDKILESRPSWPCLEHLRLSFRTSHTKLLPFFEYLSPSLRSLELIDMDVGDARQLLTQMPEILKLDAVRLDSIWHTRQTTGIQCLFPESTDVDAPVERAVRSYLLRKSNECPNLGLDVEI